MEKSVLALCAISQNPERINMGIFVVIIAVKISISRGIAANLVKKPQSIKTPQFISKIATNIATASGAGIPIFKKRPTPRASGKTNFCSPSDKKTNPIIIRIKMVAEGAEVLIILLKKPSFISAIFYRLFSSVYITGFRFLPTIFYFFASFGA